MSEVLHGMLPEFGFTAATMLIFEAALWMTRRVKHPALNPTLLTILVIMAGLAAGRVPYPTYARGSEPLAWLLGPATVALGVPLARNLSAIIRDSAAIFVSLTSGALTAAISGPLVLKVLGGTSVLGLAMAPKAATTPIAMVVAQEIGASPSLAAVFAIAGGVIVAIAARPLLGWFGIEDHRAFGLAAGVAGSGIGAAEAVARDPEAGAYAALGVGLTALATALVVPVLATLVG
ncbi:LrgB family protein [Acidiphilium sp. C61]|uniref:LrgB family protein n=1 Tax=Acidiphilium sp. C61 TaxID=1671485 RepID=UPI00157A4E74|nr:LrgB family protein [Acidiphilium sp. C61]